MISLFGGEKRLIGLDIGSHSVKACVLKPSKKGWKLVKYGVRELPSECIVDGAIMNGAAVSEVISELLAELKPKLKGCATSISGNSVIIKIIQVPFMTADSLRESIQFEAEQYVPFDINDVNLDFEILSAEADAQGKMDVLLVAAKKDMVNDYATVISESGYVCEVVEHDAFSVENMFCANYELAEGEIIALVDVGASVTNLNVLKSGRCVFTRDAAIGGNLLTEEIQKQLNVSYREAETFKIGRRADEASDEVIPQEVESIIATVGEQIVTEIQKSVDYFIGQATDQTISKIYLSGGASQTPGLIRLLQERLSIPCEFVNPFNSVVYSEKEFEPARLERDAAQMAVSVGLAMRRVGDK